jgi:hypothetical protein
MIEEHEVRSHEPERVNGDDPAATCRSHTEQSPGASEASVD